MYKRERTMNIDLFRVLKDTDHNKQWFTVMDNTTIKVTIFIKSPELVGGKIVSDDSIFLNLKTELESGLVNNILCNGMNPTAENMAKWMLEQVNELMEVPGSCCYKVTVQESEGNVAAYIDEEA